MAWLWDSYDQFAARIAPVELHHEGPFRAAQCESRFEHEQRIHDALADIGEGMAVLRSLGFGRRELPSDRAILGRALEACLEIDRGGEVLLMYHRRLAESRYAYGFQHQKGLSQHWDRYAATERIFHELNQLIVDVEELLRGVQQLVEEDRELLVGNVDDLPEALVRDFHLARDLFSVGFDDPGLLIAGRGLEGVLREVARAKGVIAVVKGRPRPAHELDSYDVIEVVARLRWKADNARLLDRETAALLQFIRAARNGTAHPTAPSDTSPGRLTMVAARELARVIARAAAVLWTSTMKSEQELAATEILKDWS